MEGYVKLHRQLIESTQFADPIRLKIWIWCLIKANHKKRVVPLKTGKGYTTVTVKRGQFIFGRNKASEELNVPPSTLLRHMEKLQQEKAINIRSDNQYSVITICKYEEYQSLEELNEQPMDNQRTTNGLASDTNKNDNNEKNDKKKKVSFAVSPLSSEQTGEIYNSVKQSFLELYANEYQTEYYFLGVDGTKIRSIIKKVAFKMKEKFPDVVYTVENLSNACEVFIKATHISSDDWLKANFNLKNIDSKFNDIYSQLLINHKNGKIIKHTKPLATYDSGR